MFNIGGGELIVILLIALIVLGPQRLPDAARQLGKAMSDLRRLSSGFQNEMKQALETADEPTRVTARRNVLSTDPSSSPSPPVDEDAAAGSIAAVSAQPSAPADPPAAAVPARASSKKAAQAPQGATPKPRPTDPSEVEPEPASPAKPSASTRTPMAGERSDAPPRPTDG